MWVVLLASILFSAFGQGKLDHAFCCCGCQPSDWHNCDMKLAPNIWTIAKPHQSKIQLDYSEFHLTSCASSWFLWHNLCPLYSEPNNHCCQFIVWKSLSHPTHSLQNRYQLHCQEHSLASISHAFYEQLSEHYMFVELNDSSCYSESRVHCHYLSFSMDQLCHPKHQCQSLCIASLFKFSWKCPLPILLFWVILTLNNFSMPQNWLPLITIADCVVLFPKGCGFLGMHVNAGQNLSIHGLMLSSRHEIQDGK